jgi:hypothetical protein
MMHVVNRFEKGTSSSNCHISQFRSDHLHPPVGHLNGLHHHQHILFHLIASRSRSLLDRCAALGHILLHHTLQRRINVTLLVAWIRDNIRLAMH